MLQRIALLSIVVAFSLVLSVNTVNAQLINWTAPREGIPIDSMNAVGGNNWAISYGVAPTSLQVNTTASVEGGSSISLTIDPSSAFKDTSISAYAGAISKPLNMNLANATNFYFWVYIKDASEFVGNGNYGVVLEFTNDNWITTDAYCPVYSTGIQNGWTPVVIARAACHDSGTAPVDWSKNIDAIGFRVNLADNITKSVMVNLDNLRYNYGGGPFDRAQVILTFDGGWNSTYFNASKIMKNNGQTGVMFVVTGQVNSQADCNPICITTDQLKTLYNNYGWDIASHTVDHTDLVTNPSALDNYELSASYDSLINWDFTRSASFFAYPNGDYNPDAIGAVNNNHYIMARALNFGITQPNMYPNDPYNLSYRIQSIVMTPSVTAAMTYNYINQVVLEKGLLVLTFHVIQPNPQGDPYNSVEYSTSNFTAISNYLNQMQQKGLLQVTNFSAYYSVLNGYNHIPPASGGLVGYWKFDEGSGTVAKDSSPYNNTGTLYNCPAWVTGRSCSGYALSFNGNNQYVTVNNVPVNTSAGARNTASFWMYWTGTDNQMPLMFPQSFYDIAFYNGCFGFNTGNGDIIGIPSTGLANRWVHVAAIFYNGVPTPTAVSLYINGVKQNIYQCSSTTIWSRSVNSTVEIGGGWYSNYYFGGTIDEVKVWNRALSSAEIIAEYDNGTSTTSTTSTTTSTCSTTAPTTTTIPPNNALLNISVTATDSNDPYLRDWNLFVGEYPYLNTSTYTQNLYSGGTLSYTKTYPTGNNIIYFYIGQSGGSAYGTYSVTMRINNQPITLSYKQLPVSGVDNTHALKVLYNTDLGIMQSSVISFVPSSTTTSTTSTTTSTCSTTAPTTTTIPPNNALLNVSVTASDPQDSYARDWQVFVNEYPGAPAGNGKYSLNSSTYYQVFGSGDTMSFMIPPGGSGTEYFVIGQSGGPSYGTYSGNVSFSSSNLNGGGTSSGRFSGLDVNHALKLVFSESSLLSVSVITLSSPTSVYQTIYSCDTYQTVYVGQNLTCGQFTLHLAALGSPNQAGQSPISFLVYDNGVLTNSSSVGEYNTTTFNIAGIRVYTNVGTTFAGLYSSQNWAQIQLGVI